MGKQKKVWSELQDQLLKKFYEEQKMRNWSLIAKKMSQQHNTPKKSGKQCRERYENHIDSSVMKIEWTRQEQKQLIVLHNEIGNKWANIAVQLPGKSDNCVKNHFYSKLRKVLRKLNKIIHAYCRRQFRQININVIYKLVEATQQRFKDRPSCNEEISLKCRDIQNRMLDVEVGQNEEEDSEEGEQNLEVYKDIIREIYSASRQYKRKSKKSRNLSIQAPNVKKSKETKSKTIVVRSISKAPSDGYMSDSEHGSLDEDESNSKFSQQNYHKRKMHHAGFIENEQNQKLAIPEKKIQIEQGKQGIENMLRENNILESDFTANHLTGNHLTGNNLFKFSDKSSFKSYNSDRESDKDYFNMFQSSDAEHGSRRKNSKYLYFAQKPDDNKSICFSEKE